MLVLGIETSCDETAAAVLEDGTVLHSNVIASQDEIHSKFGGIVPELAGRCHVERIHFIIERALQEAKVSLKDIQLIAATEGPGLVVSLLVGLNTAKAIAYSLRIPVIGVNHLEGHVLAIFLQQKVEFPYLALIVSGGHTDLCRVDGFGQYRILGRTRDDAAGESFDKVAKMLGLGYPGGPIIEKKAREGNPQAHTFPRAFLEKSSLDFSFSGLKTSVRNVLLKRESGNGSTTTDEDIAAGFQEAVVDVLIQKTLVACKQESLQRVVVTGGVAANGYLRERMTSSCKKEGIDVFAPKPVLCTDNAAMIACAGYYRSQYCSPTENDPFSLDAHPNLPF
ncbi:MAG: tRNA (adenosine(37)-N6)-threonylcarbamoyltransferase complex transferase subunit TsaD [Nitrospinota bacterium]|nr:tRNA (adenosine(37)-N6)-threonylcarbamoyltransferase complex transferase subunit TsaD [Nitrospinota bacterium]